MCSHTWLIWTFSFHVGLNSTTLTRLYFKTTKFPLLCAVIEKWKHLSCNKPHTERSLLWPETSFDVVSTNIHDMRGSCLVWSLLWPRQETLVSSWRVMESLLDRRPADLFSLKPAYSDTIWGQQLITSQCFLSSTLPHHAVYKLWWKKYSNNMLKY